MVYCLTSLLFFNIPLFYDINLRSSIICSPRDIYISLGISVSLSSVCKLFCGVLLETLLLIKWPDTSAVFWITLFSAVLSASVADFLAWSRCF